MDMVKSKPNVILSKGWPESMGHVKFTELTEISQTNTSSRP